MAEVPGAPHDAECSHATGTICVCSCRGALHGIAHRGGAPALIRRMADVTVHPGRHPDQVGADITAAPDARVGTPAERRRHPVTVTVAQTDLPAHTGPVNVGPVVTHTSSRVPADLTAVSDGELLHHFAAAAEAGSDHDAQRVFDEMGRREDALAAATARRTPPRPLHAMTDEELAQTAHDAGPDTELLGRVYAEMDRRDQEATRQAHAAAHAAELAAPLATWSHEQTPEDVRLDELLGRGWDYLDAYAEVHNLDPAQLKAQQHAGVVDRQGGEHLDRAVRRQYDEHVHLSYVATRARKYASEDLLRHWADHGGRLTFQQFRGHALGRASDVAAGKVTARAAQGKDFG